MYELRLNAFEQPQIVPQLNANARDRMVHQNNSVTYSIIKNLIT